jgi:transcription elongation GreA/GreB family factor
MSYYVILDSCANLVESFDDEAEGRAALVRIVQQDPDDADEYALLQYDNSGQPIGEALLGSELGIHVEAPGGALA